MPLILKFYSISFDQHKGRPKEGRNKKARKWETVDYKFSAFGLHEKGKGKGRKGRKRKK